MQNYIDVLNAVADKERGTVIVISVVAILLIAVIWTAILITFKKEKIKYAKLYASNSEKKDRRKAVWASVAISVICIGLSVLLNLDTVNLISDIKRDISESSYITYTGEYYISTVVRSKQRLYDQWVTVDLDNGEYVFLYMDGFKEYLQTEEGRYNGKLVYAENSLIVVEIDNH